MFSAETSSSLPGFATRSIPAIWRRKSKRHCPVIRLTTDAYTHIGLDDQRTAIELLPAPPALRPVPANGNGALPGKPSNGKVRRQEAVSGQPAGPIAEIGQLDAVWATLPDNVKSGILALVNAAVRPQEGSVASVRNCSPVAS